VAEFILSLSKGTSKGHIPCQPWLTLSSLVDVCG
jgi:hypothetical protein